jgi:hypothetical protein
MSKMPFGRLILFVAVLMLIASPDAIGEADRLTAAQVQAMRAVKSRSEKKAAPLALKLAETARLSYENMLSDKEDETLRQRLERELDRIVVELVNLKGQSIREMVAILTKDQKKLLRAEMKKPDAPADLSEIISRVFKIAEK